MIEVRLDIPQGQYARAEYTIRLLLNALGCAARILTDDREPSPDGILLYYGDLGKVHRRPPGQSRVCIQAVPREGTPQEIRYLCWRDEQVPVLFWEDVEPGGVTLVPYLSPSRPAVTIAPDGGEITVHGDLIWSSFYLLSRWEEYDPVSLDVFGRFPAQSSLAFRHGFLRFPVVDAYIALLDDLLLRLYGQRRVPCLRTSRWPEGRRWALCLSHDVDWVRKWTPGGMLKYLLHSGPTGRGEDGSWRGRLKTMLADLAAGHDPYDNLGDILRLEEHHGAHSTFFFLPGTRNLRYAGRKVLGGYGKRFDTGGNARQIRRAGGEVELHGSYTSYDDAQQLVRERDMFREQCGSDPVGIRQHFLRYRFPQTGRSHQQAGLKYDSTLGFGDQPGYRCGTSFPLDVFDLPGNGPSGVLEIPLVIMDGGLSLATGGREKGSWELVEELLRRAGQFGGVCTVLWHNTSFCELDDNGLLQSIYVRLLEHSRRTDAWLCSCGRLSNWWRWRQSIQVGRGETRPGGGFRWRLRLPPPGQEMVDLEVLTRGSCRLEAPGCRCRPRGGERDGLSVAGLQIADWNREDIAVHLLPG